ncbi:hypothetical protein Syun_006385 [Stephania yunnanensis]|uniref:Ubiquitin-like domain-containing protein n=1 Tax=Stephania yunnanensis TaxID=152371 RepID=A0AAP0PZ92_9MAGN
MVLVADQSVEGDGQQMESLPFELNGRRLQIHVTSPAGSIPVEIAPTDTVNDLKQKIFEKVKVIPDDQRLVMGNSLVEDGVVFDRVLAILDRRPELANRLLLARHEAAPGGPDTGTVHVTIIMVKRLRGGGNAVFHEFQLQSGSLDSDCDSDANTVSDQVQGRQRSRLIMPDISNENKNLKNDEETLKENFPKSIKLIDDTYIGMILQLGVAVSVHSVANDAPFAGHHYFRFKFFVSAIVCGSTSVEVGVSDTLRDLKQKVFASEEIDPGNQRFMFGGNCLIDDEVAVVDQMNAILAKQSSPLLRLTFKLKGGEDDGEEKEPFKLNGRRLQIHVVSLTAREIPVVITPTDTLLHLNQKILDTEKIPIDQQRLIFGDSQLSDGIVFDQVNAILAR